MRPTTTPCNVANRMFIYFHYSGYFSLFFFALQKFFNLNHFANLKLSNLLSLSVLRFSIRTHWKMFPNFTRNNKTNISVCNTELRGKGLIGLATFRVSFPYFYYLFISKEASSIFRSFASPSFFSHIIKIVFAGSNEKVGGIATKRIVATMTNHFPIQNWSEGNYPSKSVSANVPSVAPENTVTMSRFAALKFPTIIFPAGFYLFPESFIWFHNHHFTCWHQHSQYQYA